MRIPLDTLLQRSLERHGLPEHVRLSIYNDVFPSKTLLSASIRRDEAWLALTSNLRAVIRSLVCNKSTWPEDMAPVYGEYLDTLRAALVDINAQQSRMMPDPLLPKDVAAAHPQVPITLRYVTLEAEDANAGLAIHKHPLLPERTSAWPTWVAPHVRTALIERFDSAYALNLRGRGNRLQPFMSKQLRTAQDRQLRALRSTLAKLRETARAPGADTDIAYTKYGALTLAAVNLAERKLAERQREIDARRLHPVNSPLPVNWMHLLPERQRRMMKEGGDNPGSINEAGLTTYLRIDPNRDKDSPKPIEGSNKIDWGLLSPSPAGGPPAY